MWSHHSRTLPVGRELCSLLGRRDDVGGQRGEHRIGPIDGHEHVDVDVDRAPRSLGAPGECERTTEGVGQVGGGQRLVDGDDLRRQLHADNFSALSAPNRGYDSVGS